MPITITIELEKHDTLLSALERAGLLPAVPPPTAFTAPLVSSAVAVGPTVDEMREMYAAPGGVLEIEPAAQDGVPQPEPKKRGRPRGSTAAAVAARNATPAPTEAAEDWLVRRFGGNRDTAHPNPASAAARLEELIGAAGDIQALDELMDVNGDLLEALPEELAERVTGMADATRESLKAPAAPAPEVVAAPSWPLAENREPLTVVQPNKQGARDVIMAIATGPAPKYGHMAGLAVLSKFGVSKLSEMTDEADPRFAQIAAAGAELLGLPMAGGLV